MFEDEQKIVKVGGSKGQKSLLPYLWLIKMGKG